MSKFKIGFSALRILTLVTVVVVIVFIFFIPNIYELSGEANDNGKISKSLQMALDSSAHIYMAQQKKPPVVFSDFVVRSGNATEPKTLSLGSVNNRLKAIEGLDSKKMTLKFKPDGKQQSTYYLNGTDVTAEYKGF